MIARFDLPRVSVDSTKQKNGEISIGDSSSTNSIITIDSTYYYSNSSYCCLLFYLPLELQHIWGSAALRERTQILRAFFVLAVAFLSRSLRCCYYYCYSFRFHSCFGFELWNGGTYKRSPSGNPLEKSSNKSSGSCCYYKRMRIRIKQ